MIIIALIILTVLICDVPGWAQQSQPFGSIQPFEGLNNTYQPPAPANPAYNAPQQTQSYPAPNYGGNSQFYQNPNYPLQGSMHVDGGGQMQPNNAQPNNAPAGALTSAPTNMPPTLTTGYPMPGGLQPFSPSLLPSPTSIPEESRRKASEIVNQAYELSNSGNNEQAIALLKQAESLDPSAPMTHLDLSCSYMALKDYDDALKETTILLSMDPNNEKAYVNYLAAAIGSNRMQDALRVGQEYLNRFPNGENRSTMANEVVAVEQELDQRLHMRGVVPPRGAPDNYVFFCTPNGVHRWPSANMPLRVFVNHGNHCKGFRPEFETVLINSFLIWQNATHGTIRFIPVDRARDANIECDWTDSAANIKLAAEAGEAKLETVGPNIVHVKITLLTCRPDDPSIRLTNDLLQQVCLHEIGHGLGIDGHSDCAQDIMFASTNPNVEHPQITQRDVNTLYLIYTY